MRTILFGALAGAGVLLGLRLGLTAYRVRREMKEAQAGSRSMAETVYRVELKAKRGWGGTR